MPRTIPTHRTRARPRSSRLACSSSREARRIMAVRPGLGRAAASPVTGTIAPPGLAYAGSHPPLRDPMFDTLEGNLNSVFRRLRSRGKLHPKQVDSALTDIRTALLDADVALDVVEDFLGRVRFRSLSDEVMKT